MIVILGNSMVGNWIYEKIKDKYEVKVITKKNNKGVSPDDLIICDVFENNFEKIIESIEPEIIINTIALTNVDLCEKEPKLAEKINYVSTKKIKDICQKENSYLIHFSTDYVFNGKNGDYTEISPTDPINIYGLTKLKGEKEILKYEKSCILRISSPFGPSKIKDNFFLWLKKQLEEKNKINIVTDQMLTPTYYEDIQKAIEKLIKNKKCGIYHLGNKDKITRYEFAKKISEIFDLKSDLILPIKSDQMNWIAKRPKNSSLNSNKIENDLNIKLHNIKKSLKKLCDFYAI